MKTTGKLIRWNEDIKEEENTLYAIPAIEGSHFLFTRLDQECDIMSNLTKAKKVKDLMLPLEEYAIVSDNANVYDAFLALEAAAN